MKATFHHSENQTDIIKTFWFEPVELMRYTAGQFTELTLPHANTDDRGDKRFFTLSSSPSEERVSITTKIIGNEGSSFKRALASLEAGTEVDLAEPMGDFVLPKQTKTPLIFVAGGIGLTPFHSMAQWLVDNDEKRDVEFIYAVRNEDEIIFQEVFERAGFHTTIVVGEPSAEWGGERGRLSADMILGLHKPTTESLIYVSGPEPMTEALEKDFHQAGINKNQLVLDFFPGYQNNYSN